MAASASRTRCFFSLKNEKKFSLAKQASLNWKNAAMKRYYFLLRSIFEKKKYFIKTYKTSFCNMRTDFVMFP